MTAHKPSPFEIECLYMQALSDREFIRLTNILLELTAILRSENPTRADALAFVRVVQIVGKLRQKRVEAIGRQVGNTEPTNKTPPYSFKGVDYSSLAAVRWAVFFDNLGVSFVSAPRPLGFTPDFYLPALDSYLAIGLDSINARALAIQSGHKVYVTAGDPKEPVNGSEDHIVFYPGGGGDSQHYWCLCGTCGALGIEFEGRSHRLDCPCKPYRVLFARCRELGGENFDNPILSLAYERARSFHGDSL